MARFIPFNKPYMTGKELWYISQAHHNGHLSGDGPFTRKCNEWLESIVGARRALLVHSATAALEMSAILADIQPGDEVILPSYTFVSTANAFVLRGAVPVFVDIEPDTKNIDVSLIPAAVTKATKAIVPVHYAGVGCAMGTIMEIADAHHLVVIEDAAQGILCSHNGRALGSFGHLAAISFHETKNIISGEGGALLVNDPRLIERAEILREKGTNRSQYFRGEVDKYTWVDIGSSYLPSELIAAFLWAQMEEAHLITEKRLAIWKQYHDLLEPLERGGYLTRPVIPEGCVHNAHMYYIVLRDLETRTGLIGALKDAGFHSVFHYVPLHSSPAGQRYGRVGSTMKVTDGLSSRLLRLPLYVGLDCADEIAAAIGSYFEKRTG